MLFGKVSSAYVNFFSLFCDFLAHNSSFGQKISAKSFVNIKSPWSLPHLANQTLGSTVIVLFSSLNIKLDMPYDHSGLLRNRNVSYRNNCNGILRLKFPAPPRWACGNMDIVCPANDFCKIHKQEIKTENLPRLCSHCSCMKKKKSSNFFKKIYCFYLKNLLYYDVCISYCPNSGTFSHATDLICKICIAFVYIIWMLKCFLFATPP